MTPDSGSPCSHSKYSTPVPIWLNLCYSTVSPLNNLNEGRTFTLSQRLQTKKEQANFSSKPICPLHPTLAQPVHFSPPPSTTHSALLRLKTHHMVIDERGPPPGIKWAGSTSSSRAAPASVLSARPALGPHPPSSATTTVQASTTPFSRPIKGEVNEAWGGNYTNANRQMSHIVPSYNKQYGCLWCICIRKGGALRKPCFDCILQRADYFFPGPSAFSGSDLLPFLCDFVSSRPSCWWGFGWLMCCQLKTVVCWATLVSVLVAKINYVSLDNVTLLFSFSHVVLKFAAALMCSVPNLSSSLLGMQQVVVPTSLWG